MTQNFYYFPTLTHPQGERNWRGLSATIEKILASRLIEKKSQARISPEQMHIFSAGHPQMVQKTKAWLLRQGFVTPDEMADSDLPLHLIRAAIFGYV